MSNDPIASFLVQLGLKTDDASVKRAVNTVNKAEADVTKAAEDGAKKRTEVEQTAATKRVSLVEMLGRIATTLEQDRADRVAKIRKDEAAQDEKLQAEREKKARERRAAAVKEIQVSAARMAAFAIKTIAGVEAVALGVVTATERAARAMERMNYSAQRSGTTPEHMAAYSYASGQLGSTEEAGQAAVSAIGKRLRDNPNGFGAVLRSMGIAAKDAKGHLRDAEAVALDLGDAFAKIAKSGPYGMAQAKGRAEQWGITDDDQLQTMMDPRMRGMVAEKEKQDKAAGLDRNAAVKDGTAFEQSFRRLEGVVDSIRQKVASGLFKTLQGDLDKLSDWGEKHGEQIASIIGRIADDIVKLATAVLNDLSKVDWDKALTGVENFAKGVDKACKDVFGESGAATLALAAFGLSITTKVLGPLNAVLGAMRLIGGLNPAVLGTAAVGAVLASGDPDKIPLIGKHPDVRPEDNNLGLPGVGEDNPSDTATAKAHAEEIAKGTEDAATGFWGWVKAKAKDLGWGDRLPGGAADDKKVKDAILKTAEGVTKLADGANGGGEGGGGGGALGAARRTLGWTGRALGGGQEGRGGGPSSLRSDQQKANAAAIADELRKAGAPDEGVAAVLGSMQTESSFSPRAHNDVTGGHTGLWQWDARRWPKIRAWIEKQGGDPWDARWQTKAYIAEGRAKPGDAIYDNEGTSGGFRDIMDSKGNLPKAVHGVQRSERFGVGEEGGRAAHALKWMGNLPETPAAATNSAPQTSAVTDAEVFAARQRILNGSRDSKDRALIERYGREQTKHVGPHGETLPDRGKPVKVSVTDESASKIGHRLAAAQDMIRAHYGTTVPSLHPHAHLSAVARAAIDNSRKNVAMSHNPTYNINGGHDGHTMLADAHRHAGRQYADLVRGLNVKQM